MPGYAELKIVITDSGAPPVGASAPPGASSQANQPTATQAASTTAADIPVAKADRQSAPAPARESSVKDALGDVAKLAGMGGLFSAASKVADVLEKLTASVLRNRDAHEAAAGGTTRAFQTSGRPTRGSEVPISPGTDLIIPPRGMAAPSATGMIKPPAGAAAAGAEGLTVSAGLAAAAVAAMAAAAVAAGMAIGKVVDYLQGQAEKLSSYSPELAGATAQSEIREVMAEMRRAQRVGRDLAGFENARSRFESLMSDVGTRIMEILLQVWKAVEPIVKVLLTMAEVQMALGEPIIDALKVIVDVMTAQVQNLPGDINEMLKDIKDLPKRIAAAFEDNADPLNDPFTKELSEIGAANDWALTGKRRRPIPGGA